MIIAPVPYRVARIVSLSLTFALGIVALAMDINADTKGANQKGLMQTSAPSDVVVTIDTTDITTAGGLVAGFCTAVAGFALLALIMLLATFFTAPRRRPTLSTRTLPIQAVFLTAVTVGLFSTLIAMTDLVANKGAKVSATIGGIAVPSGLLQVIEQYEGASTEYKDISYLRLAVIFPWIVFLFGALSSVLTMLAALQARRARMSYGSTHFRAAGARPMAMMHESKDDVQVSERRV